MNSVTGNGSTGGATADRARRRPPSPGGTITERVESGRRRVVGRLGVDALHLLCAARRRRECAAVLDLDPPGRLRPLTGQATYAQGGLDADRPERPGDHGDQQHGGRHDHGQVDRDPEGGGRPDPPEFPSGRRHPAIHPEFPGLRLLRLQRTFVATDVFSDGQQLRRRRLRRRLSYTRCRIDVGGGDRPVGLLARGARTRPTGTTQHPDARRLRTNWPFEGPRRRPARRVDPRWRHRECPLPSARPELCGATTGTIVFEHDDPAPVRTTTSRRASATSIRATSSRTR